jgi:type IX secretion system PorP/SprF family membrane protein
MVNALKYYVCLPILILGFQVALDGQEGLSYQATMISNPSLAGSQGDGIARLSYVNLYPGNNYNFHSVMLSYDSYFPELHGGAGIHIADEYLGGIVNNLRGGFCYSYYLQAGKDIFIAGGLSASFIHLGYDFTNGVLPDQIDPLRGAVLPPGETLAERGRTVLDLAAGFLFFSGKYFGGFSVNHLAEPDPSGSEYAGGKLKRAILIHGAADFNISSGKGLSLIPMAAVEMASGLLRASAGVSLESKFLSVNAIILSGSEENIDLQAGFSISAGDLMFFYNYRFNMISGENLLPFSLLHHTGIAFSLNTVDKRKAAKTINFPKL